MDGIQTLDSKADHPPKPSSKFNWVIWAYLPHIHSNQNLDTCLPWKHMVFGQNLNPNHRNIGQIKTRNTPLSQNTRCLSPPLKWIVLGVVSDYLLLVRWHSTRSRCSISGQRRPDNRATPTRKLVFNGAVHKYKRLVRAKSATNQLKIKESSVGLPLNMFLCCKLYVAWMKKDVYLVVWLLSISRLRRR